MKARKYLVFAAVAVMVAAVALVGCSSGSASSSATSSDASASASAEASSSAAAAEGDLGLLTEGVVVFATTPDYPPFENMEDGATEPVGFDIALAQAVAEKLGLEAQFSSYGDFDALFPAVQTNNDVDVAISGITITPEREEIVAFSDSYYVDDLAIAAMKDSALAEDALNDAAITIAVQRGTTGNDYVKENYPNAQCMELSNSTDAFAAMQAGQAQAVCTNKAVVDRMLANAYGDAEVILPIATNESYGIAVNQGNTALLEAINGALAELQADGTIDKLVEEYL